MVRLAKHLATPWYHLHRTLTPQREGFRILTFHDIPDSQIPAFERLIDYIHGGIIDPADMHTVNHFTTFLLTFDDGFGSHLKIGRILAGRNIKAVFFVCSGPNRVIGENVPAPQDSLMEWDQVQEIAAMGHTIGSHSILHAPLGGLKAVDELHEIIHSGDELEMRLGRAIRWFAWPFGNLQSFDRWGFQYAKGRYDFICSGVRGLNTLPLTPHALFRDPVNLNDPWDYQRLSLTGGLDFLYVNSRRRLQEWDSYGPLRTNLVSLNGTPLSKDSPT